MLNSLQEQPRRLVSAQIAWRCFWAWSRLLRAGAQPPPSPLPRQGSHCSRSVALLQPARASELGDSLQRRSRQCQLHLTSLQLPSAGSGPGLGAGTLLGSPQVRVSFPAKCSRRLNPSLFSLYFRSRHAYLWKLNESVSRDVGVKLSYSGHIQSRDAPSSCPPGTVHGLYLLQNHLFCEEWISPSFFILFFGSCLLCQDRSPQAQQLSIRAGRTLLATARPCQRPEGQSQWPFTGPPANGVGKFLAPPGHTADPKGGGAVVWCGMQRMLSRGSPVRLS